MSSVYIIFKNRRSRRSLSYHGEYKYIIIIKCNLSKKAPWPISPIYYSLCRRETGPNNLGRNHLGLETAVVHNFRNCLEKFSTLKCNMDNYWKCPKCIKFAALYQSEVCFMNKSLQIIYYKIINEILLFKTQVFRFRSNF